MNACLRAWALLAVVCAAHAAGPDVVSVPIAELDGRADLDGRTVEVEGRLYIWAPTQVRLLRSKAKFRIDGGEFPKPPSRDANVHMVGRVRAERGGLTVLVSTIRLRSRTAWLERTSASTTTSASFITCSRVNRLIVSP